MGKEIDSLDAFILQKQGYKSYTYSYLMTLKKDSLIGIIRCLEHNWAVTEDCNLKQFQLLMQNEIKKQCTKVAKIE